VTAWNINRKTLEQKNVLKGTNDMAEKNKGQHNSLKATT
jgi:hypothetical protein